MNIIEVLTNPPNVNFLSDVAAFEAVIVGLAIPLSLQMVSRISDRYQSEVLVREFEKEWENRLLPIFLISNIILAVVLRFFMSDNPVCTIWKVFAWFTILAFIFIAIVTLLFIYKLKRYMGDRKFIKDRLFRRANASLEE